MPGATSPARPPGLPVPGRHGLLAADAARDLLVSAGITVVETVRCTSPETAAAAAGRLGYPVVIKVDHPDLTHKSDVGGVRLGLATAADAASAAGELLALADGAAVLVQPQRRGVELAVGGIRDPDFGPVVMAGFGGVLIETQRDVQLAVAPVDEAYAAVMLASLRGAAVFGGLRGRQPVDLGPVARLICRVSELMARYPGLAELDLNPVLAAPGGAVAVDWRIRVS